MFTYAELNYLELLDNKNLFFVLFLCCFFKDRGKHIHAFCLLQNMKNSHLNLKNETKFEEKQSIVLKGGGGGHNPYISITTMYQ